MLIKRKLFYSERKKEPRFPFVAKRMIFPRIPPFERTAKPMLVQNAHGPNGNPGGLPPPLRRRAKQMKKGSENKSKGEHSD